MTMLEKGFSILPSEERNKHGCIFCAKKPVKYTYKNKSFICSICALKLISALELMEDKA